MKGAVMYIDMHSHVHIPTGLQLANLDAAGIQTAVVFVSRPHPERAHTLEEFKREFAVLASATSGTESSAASYETALGELDTAVEEAGGRLIPFGPVPLDLDAAATSEWLEHRILAKGMRGVGELVPKPGAFGDLSRVLAAASDHPGLPVVVHGFHPTTAADLSTLAGLAAEHPDVPVVVGQLGGLEWIAAIELAQRTANLWLDLATPIVTFAPAMAIRALPERCLFGTNSPYGNPVATRTLLEQVVDDRALLEAVLADNPLRLLGMRL